MSVGQICGLQITRSTIVYGTEIVGTLSPSRTRLLAVSVKEEKMDFLLHGLKSTTTRFLDFK